MNKLYALLLGAGMFIAPMGSYANPVVVELYSSQGCSSCPPADAFMQELAQQEDVLALAFHVDYWDYIGWADSFAKPEFTQRQRDYAHTMGERRIYTPQTIVNGVDHAVGSHRNQVLDLIAAPHHPTPALDLSVTQNGRSVTLEIAATPESVEDVLVQLVYFTPSAQVDIRRGENAGNTFAYTNVVRHLRVLDTLSGQGPWRIQFELEAENPGAVLIQNRDLGAMLAAARLAQ